MWLRCFWRWSTFTSTASFTGISSPRTCSWTRRVSRAPAAGPRRITQLAIDSRICTHAVPIKLHHVWTIFCGDKFMRAGHIRLADLGLAKVLKSKVDRTNRCVPLVWLRVLSVAFVGREWVFGMTCEAALAYVVNYGENLLFDILVAVLPACLCYRKKMPTWSRNIFKSFVCVVLRSESSVPICVCCRKACLIAESLEYYFLDGHCRVPSSSFSLRLSLLRSASVGRRLTSRQR